CGRAGLLFRKAGGKGNPGRRESPPPRITSPADMTGRAGQGRMGSLRLGSGGLAGHRRSLVARPVRDEAERGGPVRLHVAVPALVLHRDGAVRLAEPAVPDLGDGLAARRLPAHAPAGQRRVARVVDGDLTLEAAAPGVDDPVGRRALTL